MLHQEATPRLCWALLPILVLLAVGPAPSVGQRRENQALRREWSVYDYPDPHSQNQDQQAMCGRYNVSSVCDPNSIISRTQADAIDNRIEEVYHETTCPCSTCTNNRGYIIRVALMPRFKRLFQDNDTSTMATLRNAQMYAYMLSQKWRMHGRCNETVLIMYAERDNVLYTLTRRQSKAVLKDEDVQSISLIVRHYFDDRNTIADGLLEMIRRYKMVFQDRAREATNSANSVR